MSSLSFHILQTYPVWTDAKHGFYTRMTIFGMDEVKWQENKILIPNAILSWAENCIRIVWEKWLIFLSSSHFGKHMEQIIEFKFAGRQKWVLNSAKGKNAIARIHLDCGISLLTNPVRLFIGSLAQLGSWWGILSRGLVSSLKWAINWNSWSIELEMLFNVGYSYLLEWTIDFFQFHIWNNTSCILFIPAQRSSFHRLRFALRALSIEYC